MWIHVYESENKRSWVAGFVDSVKIDVDGNRNIVVHTQNEDGKWVLPRTFKANNQDPIPTANGQGGRKRSDYIMKRNPNLEKCSASVVSFASPSIFKPDKDSVNLLS